MLLSRIRLKSTGILRSLTLTHTAPVPLRGNDMMFLILDTPRSLAP